MTRRTFSRLLPTLSRARCQVAAVALLAIVPLATTACGTAPAVDAETVASSGQALVDDNDDLAEAGDNAAGDSAGDAAGDAMLDEADSATDGDDGGCRLGRLRARVIDRYDANGDGALDEAERAELQADIDEHPRVEQRIDRRRALHRAVLHRVKFVYDANDDHQLDDSERAVAREAARTRMQARRAELQARFDGDGDGHLNTDEKDAAREFLRARIRLEVPAEDDATLT